MRTAWLGVAVAAVLAVAPGLRAQASEEDRRQRDAGAAAEKAARADEKADREEEVYDRGTESLDEERWDRAVDAFGFSAGRAGQCVVFRRRSPFRDRTLHQNVDDHSVLSVHANQAAGFSRRSHGFEDCSIIDKKYSGIRHEEFETRYALIDEAVEFGQSLIRKIGDDHMKTEVDHRFALRLREPHIQSLIQRLAAILHSEVDDRRSTTECGRTSAGFKIIGGRSAPKWQVHVCMRIDSTGDDKFARSIDCFVRCTHNAAEFLADEFHHGTINKDVGNI